MLKMRYVFAGDRDIAVWVLNYLIDLGYFPEMLFITELTKASHSKDLIKISKIIVEVL
jgi:hypothetical protein